MKRYAFNRFCLLTVLSATTTMAWAEERRPIPSGQASSIWLSGIDGRSEGPQPPQALAKLLRMPEARAAGMALPILKATGLAKDETVVNALRHLQPILSEMSESKEGFANLEPVYLWGVALLLGAKGTVPLDHYYKYVPSSLNEKTPIVVFLHGAGPNLAAYLHRVVKLTKSKAIVVCPTSDSRWWTKDGISFIERVIARTKREHPGASGVSITGMSRGGIGAISYALRHPSTVRNVIAISAMTSILQSGPTVRQWANQQIDGVESAFDLFLVHGQRDDLEWPLAVMQAMAASSIPTSLYIEKSKDHLLFLDGEARSVDEAFAAIIPCSALDSKKEKAQTPKL